jgi:hypothetical protein
MAAHDCSEKQEGFCLSLAQGTHILRRFGPGAPRSCPNIEQIARIAAWIVLAGAIPLRSAKTKKIFWCIYNQLFSLFFPQKKITMGTTKSEVIETSP